MNKQEKLMVTRMVMAGIGMLCMLFSINENMDTESTSIENVLTIIGFVLCIPMYSSGVCHIIREYKSIEKDEMKIKK